MKIKLDNVTSLRDALNRLRGIEAELDRQYEKSRREERILQAELEERQSMGLHGDAAIEHYNAWMDDYNMQHLKICDTQR